jgi:hypothetical protein
VPVVERRALKQARFAFKKKQFVFNAGCCKDVKSKSKFKLTASRRLENMIWLEDVRSTFVDDRALHSTIRFLEGRRYRRRSRLSCHVDENETCGERSPSNPIKRKIASLKREG